MFAWNDVWDKYSISFDEFIDTGIQKKMAENSGLRTENILNNIIETIADTVQHHKSEPDKQETTSAQRKRLFGRQKTIHSILGGGQCRHSFYPYFLFTDTLSGTNVT